MGICESKPQKTAQNISNEFGGQNTQSTKNPQNMEKSQNTQNVQGMQSQQDIKIPEMDIYGNISVPIDIINKARKSVCKITIKGNKGEIFGTGFFMKISDKEKYLVTNNHIISQNNINDNIEIEIHNHRKMKLNTNNRKIEYFSKPIDITIIEIRKSDEIYNDILFLDYDSNFNKGYYIYQNVPIFLIHHPNGQKAENASGIIVNVNDFEFDHGISTKNGSSGSPIMLCTQNENSIQVIGIHKEAYRDKNLNSGTFIGEIFNNENKNSLNNNILNNHNNYIIAEIDIKDENVNKDIRIINSYEEYMREYCPSSEIMRELMNEVHIKQCEIRINNELIPFNYFYKFIQKGKYIIKYSFNNYLTNTNHIFCKCSSLTNINLSNFNTQNVKDICWMFYECSSLTNIDLSNFNTQNVKDMSSMFFGCSSLTNIDLSNFNTQNVKDMYGMFSGCKSLININISNFNTQNIISMSWMFKGCSSLININLSNFNTQNVTYMSDMFSGCTSITNINLSNFNTDRVTNMNGMFSGCTFLTNVNIITNDKRIINQFFKDKNK